MNQRWVNILFWASLFMLVCVSSILPAFSLRGGVWYSPDEQSNKLFTQVYADTGRLCYERDYLAHDSENMLHMRGGLTYNGKVVPMNFLGLPVLYGTIYRFSNDYVQFIYIPFVFIIVVYLSKLYHLLFAGRAAICAFALLTCIPLFFYLNSPYFNLHPAITLSVAGGYYLTRYTIESSRGTDLLLGSLFLAVGIFCQYYYAIFFSLFVLILLLQKHRQLSNVFFADTLIYFSILAMTFIVPVLVLNNQHYGSPLRYGYSLFYDLYFPDRAGDGASLGMALGWLKLALHPSPIDPEIVADNIAKYWYYLMPLYFALLIWGALSYLKDKRALNQYGVLCILLAIYFICYRGGDSGLWGTNEPVPILTAAILRYWLLLYIAAVPFVAYALERIMRRIGNYLAVSVMAVMLVTSLATVLTLNSESILKRSDIMMYAKNYRESVAGVTEENAIIYCGRNDKMIVPYRDVATWWMGEGKYDADRVASSMAKVKEMGYPVYLIRQASYVHIEELNLILAGYRLTLADERLQLYRLEQIEGLAEAPSRASIEERNG